jgi:hypothetical protein
MGSALFNTRDLAAAPIAVDAALGLANDAVSTVGADGSLRDVVGQLRPNNVLHYVTYGKWSNHQLVAYILGQIGPARLWMTSWSMTEQPLRQLLMLKQKGLLIDARCILSDRIIERTPAVYDLAKNVFAELKMIKLHAKVTVLMNDNWHVVVVGSANFTSNPRVEAGVIDTNIGVAEFHKKWIEHELAKAK